MGAGLNHDRSLDRWLGQNEMVALLAPDDKAIQLEYLHEFAIGDRRDSGRRLFCLNLRRPVPWTPVAGITTSHSVGRNQFPPIPRRACPSRRTPRQMLPG